MEKYKVIIFPAAKQDLTDIIEYLNTLSPEQPLDRMMKLLKK
jgi:hypothetical protein